MILSYVHDDYYYTLLKLNGDRIGTWYRTKLISIKIIIEEVEFLEHSFAILTHSLRYDTLGLASGCSRIMLKQGSARRFETVTQNVPFMDLTKCHIILFSPLWKYIIDGKQLNTSGHFY